MKTNCKGYNRFVIAMLVMITSLSIIACGAQSQMTTDVTDQGSYDSYSPEASKMNGDYAPAAMMSLSPATGDYSSDGSSGSSASSTSLLPQGRKLIRNASMSLETKVFDDLIAGINSQISTAGGYVENSSIYNGSYDPYYYDYGDPASSNYSSYNQSRSASITARVPSDKLDAFITEVKTLGNVTQYSESVDDVTLQYTDVESHKKSLEIERDRLLELMEKAEDVDTILAIESQLSEVRYELDNYESQLKLYDNQIDYSTVSIDISEVIDYTEPEEHPQSIGERISVGLSHTFKSMKTGLVDLLVWFVVNLPILILLAIMIIVIILIARLARRKINPGKSQDMSKNPDASEKQDASKE